MKHFHHMLGDVVDGIGPAVLQEDNDRLSCREDCFYQVVLII